MSLVTNGLGAGATIERLVLNGLESGEAVIDYDIAHTFRLDMRQRQLRIEKRQRQVKLDDR